MSTNSTITVRTAENERQMIYCHWDGYPTNNGAILLLHFNTHEKAIELVKHGDLSALRPRISPEPNESHSFDKPLEDVCIYYGRDRGETNVNPITLSNSDSLKSHLREYNYYFDGENWYVTNGTGKGKKLLTKKMCELD